jgi:hypothetical protein
MYDPHSARKMPIARLAVLAPEDGPIQTIASLGVTIATVVVVVVADMGGGGEWDVGGGNLGCVLCCVAQVDAPHGR